MRSETLTWSLVAAISLAGCGGDASPATPSRPNANLCPTPGNGVQVGGDALAGDQSASAHRRLVLMGGGAEDDDASLAFLEGAAGGDVVILRASGSLTSYPSYFRGLGATPPPASIQTVLTPQPERGGQPGVLCRVDRAEAVWLAGGNQWHYLGGWPAGLHASLGAAGTRGGSVGGTSAGAMVWGEAAFAARTGTVGSSEALSDPTASATELVYPSFSAPELAGMVVDTHFSERDREGRLLAFMARFLHERPRTAVWGIGLDDGIALVVESGTFRVLGPSGGSAWIYHADQPPDLQGGVPLNLAGVVRRRLSSGASGDWPPAIDGPDVTALEVVAGEVH